MQASRDARKRLYARETESAQLNSLGPGPAKYIKENADRQRFGERDRFSIPKVSSTLKHILFLTRLFLLWIGKSRNRPEKCKYSGTHHSHSTCNWNETQTKEGVQPMHWHLQITVQRGANESNTLQHVEERHHILLTKALHTEPPICTTYNSIRLRICFIYFFSPNCCGSNLVSFFSSTSYDI